MTYNQGIMMPGMNENIEYGEQTIHVQTEDLGKETAKVVTQLFLGGNVLVTKFIEYHHALESDKLDDLVVALMQRQHQKLGDQLRKGKFDDKIAQHAETAHALDGPVPINVEQHAPGPAEEVETPPETPSSPAVRLADLPAPRVIARRIHAVAPPPEPDKRERELELIEAVVENRTLVAAAPGADSLDAAMHSLFDPQSDS